MKRRPSWQGLTTRNILAGLAVLSATAPAFADRAVKLTYQQTASYARIVAKWDDGDERAPRITATINNQVLVLGFDEKVTLDLDALMESLPAWAAVTRMDADGKSARIGLKQAPRVLVSTSVDLTAVDLVPEAVSANPPPLVSPLVARREAEAAAKRAAAIPPPAPLEQLEVRGSDTSNSSRIAFYWNAPTTYKVAGQSDGVLKLLFSRQARADLAYLRISPPANLADFKHENTDKGFLVTLTSKDGMPIKHFDEAGVAVVDISRPPPPPDPEEAAQIAAAPKPPVAQTPPAPPPSISAQLASDRPVTLAPPLALLRDEDPVDARRAAAGEKSEALGGRERQTVLSSIWTEGAPLNGVVDVVVSPLSAGLELQVAFASPAPAAVFARGSAIWAIFAANADLKVDPVAVPTGYRIRTLRSKDATMLRIETPRSLTVSAESVDATWRITLAPAATRPERFLKPERTSDRGGFARVETMLPGAAGLVWFEDPVVGDLVAAAVAYGPTSASPASRDFVEASLPATAHGLAIAPRSDNVLVMLEGERVTVRMAGGSAESITVEDSREPPAPPVNPAFIDFKAWGGLSGNDFFKRRTKLEMAVAELDLATAEAAVAMAELARFYLGHDLPMEALGVMRIAAHNRPEVEQDPRFLGMRGAANVMTNRLVEAEADLATGELRGDPSAALWRAMIAVQRGEWERALDHMRVADGHVFAYPPEKSAHFTAAFAEAALYTNDYDTARRQAEVAKANGTQADAERAELVLATLTSITEGPSAAYAEFQRLATEAAEPVAVHAELKRLEAGVAGAKMTANDAAAELESLRFRWRGDSVEMATVGILADQYMRVGRFREALLLAQSAAFRDPTAPGSRDLRIRLTEYFRRLFLRGEADRLDPIQALALFYEFAESLTPVGTDGDAMIRKLAQRLVAFDLLDPAAQLLQHQVDNRMRGVGKAAIAVDLATIYLSDKRPDRALMAINSTRQTQLPKDLAMERRLIEAAAYRDMGRYDHVIELVESIDGADAKSLLADAYWRGRNWRQSADVYLAMLPPPGNAGKKDAGIAFRAAIAARLAKDAALIARAGAYAGALDGDPNKASFDLITTRADVDGAALSEAVRRVADAPRVDAFAASLMERFRAPRTPTASAAPASANGAG